MSLFLKTPIKYTFVYVLEKIKWNNTEEITWIEVLSNYARFFNGTWIWYNLMQNGKISKCMLL